MISMWYARSEKIKRDLLKCSESYFKNETREQDHYQGIRNISTQLSLIDGAENKARMEEQYLEQLESW